MLELLNILETEVSNTTLCGGIEVPNTLFNVVATIIKGIKIVVPILLIIWGMLDFAKSVVAKKEEDIKKYQKSFISRLISAVLVFLVITIVQLVYYQVLKKNPMSKDKRQMIFGHVVKSLLMAFLMTIIQILKMIMKNKFDKKHNNSLLLFFFML